jgi:hypothetical protein
MTGLGLVKWLSPQKKGRKAAKMAAETHNDYSSLHINLTNFIAILELTG